MRHIINDCLNSFCRTDLKFCSCSDDTTVKVWDFARCQEERSLSGNVLRILKRVIYVNYTPKNNYQACLTKNEKKIALTHSPIQKGCEGI